jgi:hypothetical protein
VVVSDTFATAVLPPAGWLWAEAIAAGWSNSNNELSLQTIGLIMNEAPAIYTTSCQQPKVFMDRIPSPTATLGHFVSGTALAAGFVEVERSPFTSGQRYPLKVGGIVRYPAGKSHWLLRKPASWFRIIHIVAFVLDAGQET